MASSVPTESNIDKSMDPFGMGTYDFPESSEHGEDSNKKKSGKSLPDGGGPLDPFGPDRLLSYPQSTSTASSRSESTGRSSTTSTTSTTMVPGDYDVPPEGGSHDLFLNPSRPMSVADSKLPTGKEPSAMADYADRFSSTYDVWADHSGDTWASSEESTSESLPGSSENSVNVENGLGGLGNYWSGYNVQDQNVPAGFPSMEYWDVGRRQQLQASEKQMNRVATNVTLVRSLTGEFLEENGKKDLTRRHVMAFLTQKREPQYLASDVIRCLALDHNIFVKDVLDEFPVRKASFTGISKLASIRSKLIDLEIESIRDPAVSEQYRRAAAELSKTLALVERLGE